MKIFFISNRNLEIKPHLTILNWLKKNKHKIVSSQKESQVVIVETAKIDKELSETIFSTLMESKPVLLLYKYHTGRPEKIKQFKDKKILKNFYTKGYVPSGLASTLDKFFTDLNTSPKERFNLLITKDVEEYLDWIPYGTGQSRSDFIRNLVRDKMEKDKGYNNHKKKKQ